MVTRTLPPVPLLLGMSPPGPRSLPLSPLPHTLLGPLAGNTVTELCNVACSSVMPGGGTNLELALHCLHEAHGNVQVRRRQGQGSGRLGQLPALLGLGALGACRVPSAWGFAVTEN